MASRATSARRSPVEGKYSYTLLRASPTARPTAAGVTAAAPSRRRIWVASVMSAARCWARCSTTEGALIFGIRPLCELHRCQFAQHAVVHAQGAVGVGEHLGVVRHHHAG